MRYLYRFFSILGLSLIAVTSWAAPLDLVLTQGVSSALPIAIVPFAGQDASPSTTDISQVVRADLQNSGQFKALPPQSLGQTPHRAAEVNSAYWRNLGVDDVVVGSMKAIGGGRYQVNVALVDVFKNQNAAQASALFEKSFTVSSNQLRTLAHHISDMVYQQLTGTRGIFSTRIAYVSMQPGRPTKYTLEVADYDGYNPRPMLTSYQPIMSPAWSHDGKRLAYVSFEKITPQIYVQNVATGERRVVSSAPGINGAPAWSADDSKLALVLSKSGTPKIYTMNLSGGDLQQLTRGLGIDTEPNWSPDGKSLIFTSDRGGGPQIYQLTLSSGQIQRLTFNGSYNARASFTPDGKSIVMIHRAQGSMYDIAIQDLQSGSLQVLSGSGYDASPSVAPNGRMVLYESDAGRRGVLAMVSIDGRVKVQIPAQQGNVQDPAWSPFLG